MQTAMPKRRRRLSSWLEDRGPLLVAVFVLLPFVLVPYRLAELEEARFSTSSGTVRFPESYDGPRNPHAAVLLENLSSRVLVSYGKLLTVRDSEDPSVPRWSEIVPAEIRVATLSADGSRVVAGLSDGTIRLWDINSSRLIRRFRSDSRVATCLDLTPDGTRLLIVATDGTSAVWDAGGRAELGLFSPQGDVRCTVAALSADGWIAAIGTASGSCYVWDVAEPGKARHVPGPAVPLTALALNRDGTRLATADKDGTIRCRDPDTGTLFCAFQSPHGRVRSILFLPDGQRFVAGHADGAVTMLACAGLSPLPPFTHLQDGRGQVVSLSASAGGTQLQALWQDETVIVWEPLTQKRVALFDFGPGDGTESFIAW